MDERARKRLQEKIIAEAENENYGEDYTVMVKTLLKNYKLNKAKAAVLSKDDPENVGLADKIEFLDLCIEQLAVDEQALIRDLYVNRLSIGRAGKKYGYSKTGLFKWKERIIAVIEVLFAERYEIGKRENDS